MLTFLIGIIMNIFDKTFLCSISHKGGVTGTPGPHPSYTPEEEKDNLAVASLGPP